MTVVLPDDGRLADVEALVPRATLATCSPRPTPPRCGCGCPAGRSAATPRSRSALSALGMPTAFTDAADFTGMTDDASDLQIGAVLHQTFIAVDEDGTEAAAATAVVDAGPSSMPQYTDVVVDRPFLFVIHDVEHADPALPRPGRRPALAS